MKTLTVQCPDYLHSQLEELTRGGWCDSKDAAVVEALRRFLESYSARRQEEQLLADVEWGLKGDE